MIRGNTWITDNNTDVAIRVFSNSIKINNCGKGNGFVWIELENLVVYGCYISPNVSVELFGVFLEELGNDMTKHTKGILIGGDFNSKSRNWGAPRDDLRGDLLVEWLGERDLIILNEGDKPTFVRGNSESWIDLTFSTSILAPRITGWHVSDEENLSDHQNIYFEVNHIHPSFSQNGRRATAQGWKINDSKLGEFTRTFEDNLLNQQILGQEYDTAEAWSKIITDTCDQVFQKRKNFPPRRRPVFWWSEDIAARRRECNTMRRTMVRANARQDVHEEERIHLRNAYSECRKLLSNAIKDAKRKAWKELTEDVERDIWGNGYRIVMKKCQLRKPCQLTEEEMIAEAAKLFPTDETIRWEEVAVEEQHIPLFTLDELKAAETRIKTKKAPGPDNITAEIVKALVTSFPGICLQLMNNILTKGKIPKIWKEARLVLIEKERKEGEIEVKYRPLCLLNEMGKLLEHLIVARMWEEVNRSGNLADSQFGFRPERSTVDAIQAVQQKVDELNSVPWQRKGFCVLVTLDVKNAFNMTPWKGVVEEIRRRKMSPYIVRLICSYLEERTLIVGNKKLNITRGVPQGSVLGPLLWNIYYDEIMRIPMPEGVSIIGYADDLAIVATAATERILRTTVEYAIDIVSEWMEAHKLKLAPQKTEAVLLSGRKRLTSMTIQAESSLIRTMKSIRYLGVIMDKDMKMTEHVKMVTTKAEAAAIALSKLLPNVGGPRQSKRRVMSSVVYSILLYAAPVWRKAINIAKYRKLTEKVQRRISLRICSAYRTLSTEAAVLLADTPPIDLLIEERTELYRRGKEERKRLRTEIIDRWQERWDNLEGKAAWTKELIPDVRPWIHRKHGEINYHLTQMLTGHGCFKAYLNKFGRAENGDCWYCGANDTARHTFFECDRWIEIRTRAEILIGEHITPQNIVNIMLQSERKWNVISEMADSIMNRKEHDERQMQRI